MIPNVIYEGIKNLKDEDSVLTYLYRHGYGPGLAEEALVEWRSYQDPSMIVEKIELDTGVMVKTSMKDKPKAVPKATPKVEPIKKKKEKKPKFDFTGRSGS